MIRKMVMVSMVFLLMGSTAMAIEVGGISLPDTLKEGDTELALMGAGLRKVFGFKVYAGGLYLKKKTDDDAAIINSDKPMAIRLQWRRSAPPDKIKEVYYKSFAKVVGAPKAKIYGPEIDYGPLTNKIIEYMSWISNKKVEKGFHWNNIYVPGQGTKVYVFDGTKESYAGTIKGLDFKKALFSIWLGEQAARSVGDNLKNQMLGKVMTNSIAKGQGENIEAKDVSLEELDNI